MCALSCGTRKRKLGRWAGTRDHFGNGVAIPYANQQDFCPRGILEHVEGARAPLDFEESGTPRIRSGSGARNEKLTQFCELFLRMVSQIFYNRRLFCDSDHFCISPPHSAYLLLTSKDERTSEKFHARQQFSVTNWPVRVSQKPQFTSLIRCVARANWFTSQVEFARVARLGQGADPFFNGDVTRTEYNLSVNGLSNCGAALACKFPRLGLSNSWVRVVV